MNAKPDIPGIRFSTPFRWFVLIGSALQLIVVLPVVIWFFHIGDLGSMILFVLGGLAVLVISIRYPWELETTPEGLRVVSWAGTSRLIPYTIILKVTVTRRLRLEIYTGSYAFPDVTVQLLSYASGGKVSLRPLLTAISAAANMTHYQESVFGLPTYERKT